MKIRSLMRSLGGLLLLLAVVALARQACCAQDKSATVPELVALLGKHDDALGKKDLDALMALWTEGTNTVMMGTGPGERYEGKDEIRDAYSHITADYDANSSTHNCYWKTGGVNGDMAWLAAMCTMSDTAKKKKRQFELNVSAVLEKQDGKWLFRSMHYSNVVSGKK